MTNSLIPVVNPYSGEIIGEVKRGKQEDVTNAVIAAKSALKTMASMPLHRRSGILSKSATSLVEQAESLAQTLVTETGKTIREAQAEVMRAAGIFQIAAEECRRLHGETIPFDASPSGEGRTGYFTREPVGIVGAITPWNVPLALVAHKVAPALAGGNAVVLKPAEQTPFIAMRLAEILYRCGLPSEALQVVTGYGEEAGDALVTHSEVNFISFTGSREVGVRLPERAGYKKVALELGGNSPVIITPTANLPDAADQIIKGGFAVAGQLCISVQRIIAHRSIIELLQTELLRMRNLIVGDPQSLDTDVGCMISSEARDRVHSAIQEAIRQGAKLVVGGEPILRSGYSPTLLTDLPPDSPFLQQEAFAPLVLLLPYDSLDEAIAIANGTDYGLNAGIFTNDLREAQQAAQNIIAGAVMINDVPTFRYDNMPYGGRKQSGLGREGVRFAMEEMTVPKVVCFRWV